MRGRIFILTFVLAMLSVHCALSQGQASGLQGGEDALSAKAVREFKPTYSVQGFRLCLFNGSSQNARNEAMGVLELFNTSFPGIDAGIVYEAPIFKVLAGACISRIEATQLLARITGTFPMAFIISVNIPVTDFLQKSDTGQQDGDTLEEYSGDGGENGFAFDEKNR